MRAPGTPLLLLLVAAAHAGAPEPAIEAVREGLLSPGRGAREEAEARARDIARLDPAGVAALWDGLDLEGRCLLARALGGAGTRHAAEVALARAAAAPEEEIFRALVEGLARGGEAALFAKAPEGLPAARLAAIEELRLRYRVEDELVRLKSPSGPTGHYAGQFARMKELGPEAIPILLDIVVDRARPLPGESAAGPYRSIHPGMAAFDPRELRGMVAYGFGEVVEKEDAATIALLEELHTRYRYADVEEFRFENEDLAPSLAFSLYDLGRTRPALDYIRRLEARLDLDARRGGSDQRETLWNLGYACIRVGLHERGERYYEYLLELYENRAIAAYNLACNFSMRAQKEPGAREWLKREALRYLERAIMEFHYGDWIWMEEDGDLAFIRNEPKYRELLQHLQKKYPERKKGTVPKGRPFGAPK